MKYELKNYSIDSPIVVVRSENYASILEHSHDFIEMVYVRSGEAFNVVNGASFRISAGDLIIIPRGCRHYIKPVKTGADGGKPFRIINIIYDERIVDFDLGTIDPEPVYVKGDLEILHLISAIVEEYNGRGEHYIDVLKGHLLSLLALYLRRRHESRTGEALEERDMIERYIAQIGDYISRNYQHYIYVDEIADYVGLSKGYLQRIFKRRSGMSLIEYIIRYRIQESCKLLIETEDSISEIASQVGFSDLKHFYSKFKALLNQTPRDYRMLNRSQVYESNEEELYGKC